MSSETLLSWTVTFEVESEHIFKNAQLYVDKEDNEIHFAKNAKTEKSMFSFHANTILKVLREDSTELRLFFRRHVPILITFPSHNSREMFCQALFALNMRPQPQPHHEAIRVFVGTWNMGNARPDYEQLPAWIPSGCDLVVIGVQESSKYTPRAGRPNCAIDWYDALLEHLGGGYITLCYESLMEIRLGVFVKREHAHKITAVLSGNEATGIAHVIGNKGGVGAALTFNATRIFFLGSHLAAHQRHVRARNSNVREILQELRLGLADGDGDFTTAHDHVFWLGDLNYRIDLPRDTVIECVRSGDRERLLEHDQLLRERRAGRVFAEFQEGAIAFNPTYRYCRGSREYSEEKQRIPAWCDRVLWRSLPALAGDVHLEEYTCCDAMMTSDHSPVGALFTVATRLPMLQANDVRAVRVVLEGLRATLDSAPPEGSPEVEPRVVDTSAISDPHLELRSPYTAMLRLPPLAPGETAWGHAETECLLSDPEGLRAAHLLVGVYDWALPRRAAQLGHGAIPLGPGLLGTATPFDVPLTLLGRTAGRLTGTVHVDCGAS